MTDKQPAGGTVVSGPRGAGGGGEIGRGVAARSPRLLAVLVFTCAGCSFNPSGGSGGRSDGGRGGDGGEGGDGDSGFNRCADWKPATPFDPCQLTAAGPAVTLAAGLEYVFNTDLASDQLTQGGTPVAVQPATMLVEGETIFLASVSELAIPEGARLRVIGQLPLLLVSWQDMDVAGTIDLSSSAEQAGAGANPDSCGRVTVNGGNGTDGGGGGGGGGGGFGTAGGPGGNGSQGAGDGPGGSAGPPVEGTINLRGGCPGGTGGSILALGENTPGGSGGGAIALSARLNLRVSGTIHAGGAGGVGGALAGTAGKGGGGAGSGGLIWLDAQAIHLLGGSVLIARGGQGGEGGDDNDAGNDGEDAREDGARADGAGSAAGQGGDGGRGDGANGEDPGESGNGGGTGGDQDGGGGGGGGGAGVIRASRELSPGSTPAQVRPPLRVE